MSPRTLFLVAALAACRASPAADSPPRFDRDILPVLAEHCFACHGPDAAQRQADLRLDTAAGATADRGGTRAIVPGNPEASELIARIRSSDPDVVMPPPGAHKTLTPRQRTVLERWIAAGATYEGHWAFQPLARPALPERAGGPIDAFLDDALAAAGVAPAPAADRTTLARRVTLDLTGLPPEPDDIDAFLADSAPDAYERLVDRLLASPAHAERLAAWWLDLVRYADSVGYHGDQDVTVWPYRDWVIDAFATNMPFDRFTREQLAGDLLPDPTPAQRIAAAYNRLGMMSAEGGAQAEEYLLKYAADRVRSLSGVWLGATLGCAECHDHKYDPFTTRDFYAASAFFADIDERGVYDIGQPKDRFWGRMRAVPTAAQQARLVELDAAVTAARRAHEEETPQRIMARRNWEARVRADAWRILEPVAMAGGGAAVLARQEDGTILVSGPRPETGDTTLVIPLPSGPLAGLRLEALTHDSLPARGPGRADNGNFVVTELVAALRPAAAGTAPRRQPDDRRIPLASATASFEQAVAGSLTPSGRWQAAYAIDGTASGDTVGWAVHEQIGRDQWLVVRPAEAVDVPADTLLVVTIEHHHPIGYSLGRFRLAAAAVATDDPGPGSLPEPLRVALRTAETARTAEQQAVVAAAFRDRAIETAATRETLQRAERERQAVADQVAYMPETVAVEPRPVRILPRGNWMDRSGDLVAPATPGCLPPAADPGRRPTRLDLAAWLTAPTNPLVPRVLANRLWALCFGQGLSRRLDDHGVQGEPPSHPELLDWLACDLRDGVAGGRPWDLRAVLRAIVTSRAYRRGSQAADDGGNRLLAGQNRYRIDAESVRDVALAAAGLLDRQVGGPSVKPLQPAGYWDYLNFPTRTWQADAAPGRHRRGLYVHWQRQYLHPTLMVFDAPSREECTARRPRSNTPLQALALLNDPGFVEAARSLAARAIAVAPGDDARATFMMRRAVGRQPTPREIAVLVDLVRGRRIAFTADVAAARRLAATGDGPGPDGVDPVELATWTTAARAVLNLQETYTRY